MRNLSNLKLEILLSAESRILTWGTNAEISGMYYVILIQDDIVVESKSLAIIH